MESNNSSVERKEPSQMEIQPPEAEVQEIPHLEGNSTPVVHTSVPTPPKKHKRVAPSENDSGVGRETSDIWKYFTKFINKDGKYKSKCSLCTKIFASDTKRNGTTTLWNHLTVVCKKSLFRFIDRTQPTPRPFPIKGSGQGGNVGTCKLERVVYNVNEVRRAIAEFVIIDEQPLKVIEGEGFKRLMSVVLPNFELPSRLTIARQCLKIYHEEKEKLKKQIQNQHVCLTSDTWTSLQNLTYMVITVHWIDDNWNLQKKILNFFQVPDHKGETIAKGIEACLLDWGIENLFTLTLDNATANDAANRHLKGRIKDWKGIVMENDFLHVRCNAHILNLIVKEGLSDHIESISRVRNVVKYVKSFSARLASFKSIVEKVKIDSHGLLSLDVETRWNSTYMMLSTAMKFEKAFSRLYIDDHKYQKYCLDMIGKVSHPSADEWKKVKIFTKFLDIFYQMTLKFSGTLYVTSNSFFHELFNLLNFVAKNSQGDDLVLVDMAIKMKLKFDKYWGDFGNMNMLLFVAIVLDPRYKMRYVKFIFAKSYGSVVGNLRSEKVMDTLSRLYNCYRDSYAENSDEILGGEVSTMSEGDTGEIWQSQWEKYLQEQENEGSKTDLERYLADDLELAKDFNILSWWKDASKRYPIVSRIAKDVLAIPISTVASESAFSTGGRILDSYRSSLSLKTVEALICTQQWFKSTPKELNIEDILEEIHKLELVEKEYPDNGLSID